MLDTVNLPEHRRVFDSLLRHFRNIDGVIGLFVSGSQANRGKWTSNRFTTWIDLEDKRVWYM